MDLARTLELSSPAQVTVQGSAVGACKDLRRLREDFRSRFRRFAFRLGSCPEGQRSMSICFPVFVAASNPRRPE